MSRADKVMESVNKAVAEGYVSLGNGTGVYDADLAIYRENGYDVRCWYTLKTGDKSTWQWIMYGRKKAQRRVAEPKKVAIDFDTMTVKELKKLCSEKKVAGLS